MPGSSTAVQRLAATGSQHGRRAFTRASSSSAATPSKKAAAPGAESKPIASSSRPPLRVALLLSRPPLLTPTPTPLESTYQAYQHRLRTALSNPLSSSFYFKAGSLPLRRFQRSQHQYELEAFGPRLAGKAPEVGEIPSEPDVDVVARDHWEKGDAKRGEASLERYPEEEVYCLVRFKDGKGKKGSWGFPNAEVGKGEGLDQAVRRGLLGPEGELGGKELDSWVVAKKPVGMLQKGNDAPQFFVRAHILAGEPKPSSSASWDQSCWLTPGEIQRRLKEQGDEQMWESISGVFGVPASEDQQI